jgi:hypothetical protein
MSRSRTFKHTRTIILAVLVAGVGIGCTTSSAAPATGDPATISAQAAGRAAKVAAARGLIANAREAQRQHDWQSLRRFQAGLIDRVGLAAIGDARSTYQRALADLAAASAVGDSPARAGFRAELRTLCEPGGLVGAFETCDAHAIVWGR